MAKRTNLKMLLIMAVLLLGMAPAIAAGGTIYVDATKNGDGSDWANAYKYLQDALADANSNPDVNEIWVAEGIYKPDANTANPGSDDRYATFQLISGVALYGGFGGWETNLEQRDWETYETILSGDINTPGDNLDNSYHVVTANNVDSNSILDGFTITAGLSTFSVGPQEDGAGIKCLNSSPVITNCIITDNQANNGGGGISCTNSSPVISNCIISNNFSNEVLTGGGGIYCVSNSNPTITNCSIIDNRSDDGGGAGISCRSSSSPVISNCTIMGNRSIEDPGGGIYCEDNSNPKITNCLILNNEALGYKGAGIYCSNSSPEITNCLIAGNSTSNNGGGMYNWDSSPTVTNCTFSGNSAGEGGGICNEGIEEMGSNPTITNCILWGNTAPSGPQIYNDVWSTPTVSYCDVEGGYSGTGNIPDDPLFVDAPDNLRLLRDSNCIDVGDNTAVPPDTADLDSDGDTGEVTPLDLDGEPRFINVLSKIDAGNGTPPIVDMGAYECTNIIYVDTDAPPVGNGLSWDTAFKYLQDGLAVAAAGHKIWVAEGTYKPDDDEGGNVTPNDRTETFQLLNGVEIYGGYAGLSEENRNLRDIDRYECVLSGDLADNDGQVSSAGQLSGDPCRAENSLHVVTGSNTELNTILDGFTITGGYANVGSYPNSTCIGGGMYNVSGSPTLTDCTFTCNLASYGGGMYNSGSSNPRLTNCTLSVNSSGRGGGMYNKNSSPTLTGCTFSGNAGPSGGGGGMYNRGANNGPTSSPTLTNCIFSGNSGRSGGGMRNGYDTSPRLTNCTFTGNSAINEGGGMVNGDECSAYLVNCTFIGNWAVDEGGGMYNLGGGCNPSLTNCIFTGNSTVSSGGGMFDQSNSLTLTNCVFSGNSAGSYGGGITNSGSGDPPAVTNCTFSGNSATQKGGGIYCISSMTLRNCILWGNTADVNGPQIALNNSPLNVNYCDVQGGEAAVHTDGICSITWGGSNIDSDPNFVLDPNDGGDGFCDDPTTEEDDEGANDDFGDLHLWPGSPCIDAGDNTAVPGGVTTDIDYDPRFVDGDGNTTEIVDMGSDEVVWAGEEDVGPGESVTLNPDGGPDDPNLEALVVFDNNSVSDANITVVEMSRPPNPSQGYFQALGSTLRIETSLADGEFLMTVMIPFDADDLDGVEPTDVDLRYYKPGTGPGTGWMLAVAANTQNSPCYDRRVGDRFDVLPVSDELGDYGVYWNPSTQRGFVWANVDHTTDFSPVAHDIPGDFEPDGDVDFVDFAKLALAWRTGEGEAGYDSIYDISIPADGTIDEKDLKIFTDNWLAGL